MHGSLLSYRCVLYLPYFLAHFLRSSSCEGSSCIRSVIVVLRDELLDTRSFCVFLPVDPSDDSSPSLLPASVRSLFPILLSRQTLLYFTTHPRLWSVGVPMHSQLDCSFYLLHKIVNLYTSFSFPSFQ